MEFKYNLAMVAIMKYEEDYVEEWVRYHHLLGVKHFYIYDNNEESYMKEVLKSYIEKDIVTLIPAYGPAKMFESYNHAIDTYKNECKYIAFIDADEFLMPVEDIQLDSLIEYLIEKHNDPNIGGLGVRWQIYGTNYHKVKPDGLVIENYICTTKTSFNYHIKSIVNPRMVERFSSPHYPIFKSDAYHLIDENGDLLVGGVRNECSIDKIRINHYYYKSEEEFTKTRLKRGKCDRVVPDNAIKGMILAQIERMKNSNYARDEIMLRYIDRVKNYKI